MKKPVKTITSEVDALVDKVLRFKPAPKPTADKKPVPVVDRKRAAD